MSHEATPAPGSRYFYLSYVAAPRQDDRTLGDHWVRRFYHDLNLAIDGRPGTRLRRQGFADFTVRRLEDRPEQKRIALAEAEVFVALYSPDYLNREDSRKEREWFRQRLVRAGRPIDGDNILPVLWTPSPAAVHAADQARALVLAAGVDVYAVNGMSALCRLQSFQAAYKDMLNRLAQHIVDTAEHHPLQPVEPAREPAEVPTSRPSEVPFLAVVIAPEQALVGADPAHLNGYVGARADRWRPFDGRPPVVDDVSTAVQRLRMPVEVRDFLPDTGLFEGCPGVLLIDPQVVETESGREVVRAAADCLRRWVGVVFIADESVRRRRPDGPPLLERAVGLLPDAASPSIFTTHDDWRSGIHNLVQRMRRRYLDERPAYPPPGRPISRPRLWDSRLPPDVSDDQPRSGRTE
ncbi:TIR-like protein FxsC [Plantactinospora sp. B5E13]|uniref:TIR-like protein FxsC n=1 Tax=unclassified Plantactinospora TaxID=2631981 RepID=UPI00325DCD7F